MTSQAGAMTENDPIDHRRRALRGLFDGCLERAEACLAAGRDDAAACWVLIAARTADSFGCGRLASVRLEAAAITLAGRLAPRPVMARPSAPQPRHWLHVLSIAYPVGGHTGMVRRWVEADRSGDVHHLALTFMDAPVPNGVAEAIARTGGTITLLGGIGAYLERARRLRDLAWRIADRVVLHQHMWDAIPAIAFGVAGGPPVLLLNHADHTFWVGAAVTDLLVNLRRAAEDLSIRHRGIDRNFLFRIPLPGPRPPEEMARDRASVRAGLGIPDAALVFLTVGIGHKYKPVGDLDFPAMATRLLTALPDAWLIAVGPPAADPVWKPAIAAVHPRLVALGERRDVPRFHAAADVYLEGFPFDSHTALLEAAVAALPVVRIPASGVSPFASHHFPLSAVTQPADVAAYLAQAIALARSPLLRAETGAVLHEAVVGLQCGDAWRRQLAALKAAVPAGHAVHALDPVDPDPSFDRFWTAFQMRVNRRDPQEAVFQAARQLGLEVGEERV